MILLIAFIMEHRIENYRLLAGYYYVFGFLVTFYFAKAIYVFSLFTDRFFERRLNKYPKQSRHIITKCGLLLSVFFAGLVLWGIFFGRNNLHVEHVEIFSDDLPDAFHGYRMVQISDVHAGSFAWNIGHFQKAVDLINRQEPDLIVCTGDMVNNFANELTPLIPVFQTLEAPDGKYAVLGNHDYGGYYKWGNNLADSVNNHKALKNAIEQMGFVLLNNESAVISRDSSNRIALVGVENWGKKPHYTKRGNLEEAIKEVHDIPFKVLLAHDPLFWTKFVVEKTDVTLTLSGHTHGMQMGVKLGKKHYSPARLRTRYWGGLYQTGKQYLYINCELGIVLFPGRIGMPPEITVITLCKAKSPVQR